MSESLFYLENRTSPKENVAYFWRKNGCGYTAKIGDAQEFTEDQANQLIRSAEGSHKFIKHLVGDVKAKAFSAVNIDDLHGAG